MQYQKTVEAFKWDGKDDLTKMPAWLVKHAGTGNVKVIEDPAGNPDIKYLQIGNPTGKVFCAREGDYVMMCADGSFCRVTAPIFEAEYKPVGGATAAEK